MAFSLAEPKCSVELVSLPLLVDRHGTFEIVKYEWVLKERKLLFSGPSLYIPWITHMLFVCGLSLH